jgi:hypothetical protein
MHFWPRSGPGRTRPPRLDRPLSCLRVIVSVGCQRQTARPEVRTDHRGPAAASGAPGGGGSTIPRASTFTVPSTGRSAPPRAPPGDRPSGQYNSRRDVPAPSTDTSAPYASGAYGSSHGGPAMLVTKGGLVAGSKASPLYTKAVIMVDEATEPGIGDEDGRRRRVALVEMVQTGGDPRLGNPAGNSPGAAVAHAIRKRLKSDDYVAVVNCLTLLDETMRTCPYFYRYIANDKFFRRMWRFVDPGSPSSAPLAPAQPPALPLRASNSARLVSRDPLLRVQVGPAREAAVLQREQGQQGRRRAALVRKQH